MWSWVFLTVLDTILKALGFGTCQPFNGFKQSEDATKIPLLGPRNRAAVAQSFRRCWLTHARVFFFSGGVGMLCVVLDSVASESFGVGSECGRLGLCQDSLPLALLLVRSAWGAVHYRRREKAQ